MGKIYVVHVRRDPFDVYVGRQFLEFPESPFCNQFTVQRYGKGLAVQKFEEWFSHPDRYLLRERAKQELKDKVLGCWCAQKGGLTLDHGPLVCHAQVVARVANGYKESMLWE